MLLELKHIYKNYLQDKIVIPVLKDVNISIDEGEYVAIMGPSGSGKTTLMNIIGCLDRPTKGEFLLEGESIVNYNENRLSDLRLNTLGFVFQSFNLLPKQTALDNVALPLSYAGVPVKKRKEIAFQALKRVGLAERVHFRPSQLSGGQQQRVAIARALVLNPKILLCDEATSALDPQITKGILALLSKINKELGITIVVVTHQMEVVKEICNKVAFLKNGKMIAAGKPEELFVAPNKDVQEFVGDSVEFLPKEGVNVRLFFNDDTAGDSAITHLAHELDINFGICQGKLENFRGTIMGSLVINVNEEDKERVTAWLSDRGILWEVIENV